MNLQNSSVQPQNSLDTKERSVGRFNDLSLIRKLAWLTFGLNLFVILWGTVVRATDAGAGCGDHWPLCNGEVIPFNPTMETLIEFGHRISSGFLGLLVLGLLFVVWRNFKHKKALFISSLLLFLSVMSEGLIGMAIVKLKHVADNDTPWRGVTMPLHLLNTFVLLSFNMAFIRFAGGQQEKFKLPSSLKLKAFMGAGCAILLTLAATGAIVALGDNLFPMKDHVTGFKQNFDPSSHLFVRLRIIHPILAICSFFALGVCIYRTFSIGAKEAQKYGHITMGLFAAQILFGFANYILHAPVWMQVVHLAISAFIWCYYTYFMLCHCNPDATQAQSREDHSV